MAYQRKYLIEFKNVQQDIYHIYISQKNYEGGIIALRGATASPYTNTLQTDNDGPLYAVRANVCEINAVAENGIKLLDFYSEDDEEFRIDYYYITKEGVFYAGNADIDIQSPNQVVITNQTTTLGIKPGMQITVAGSTYDITAIFYDAFFQNIQLTVAQTVADVFLNDVDFSILSDSVLLNSFFLVQDNCEEDFAAEPYDMTLKGTDNLALLKDISFTTAGMPYHRADGTNYLGNIAVFDYIKIALLKTGFGDLPLRIYSNLFENSMVDRSSDAAAEMFQQAFFYSGKYLNDDGTWKDLYTILQDILKAFNATLYQANGAWNIVRYPEASMFAGAAIPGVEHDLNTGTKIPIILNSNLPIVFNTQNILDKADHKHRIQRPFGFVKNTFNYQQPKQLIIGSDLKKLGAFITTFNGSGPTANLRYDDYDTPADWRHDDSAPNSSTPDTSYIEVVTDTTSNTEVERYLVVPDTSNAFKWLMFNPIPVTAGDTFDFTFSFKARNQSSDLLRIFTRFQIFWKTGPGLNDTNVDDMTFFSGGSPDEYGVLHYNTYTAEFYKLDLGGTYDLPGDAQQNDWNTFSLTSILKKDSNGVTIRNLPPIAHDGILVVGIDGTNNTLNNGSVSKQDIFIKDIEIKFKNRITDKTDATGQYHNNSQILQPDQVIKNNYDEEIMLDDSPRNTIMGTLSTGETTDFGYVNFLDIYMTKTKAWHRKNIDEARRLGEIIVYERMQQAFKARTIIDGSLYGAKNELPDHTLNFVSLLSFVTIDSLPLLNFIFGSFKIDWANSGVTGVLNELFQADIDSELFNYSYLFQYNYKTT